MLLSGTVQNAAGRRRHFSGNIHKGCRIRNHEKESSKKSEGDEITVSEKVYVKRKHEKRRMIKTIFGILIMVMGISIFLYPDYKEWKTRKEIEKITDGFEKEDMPDRTHQMTEITESPAEETETASETEVIKDREQDHLSGSSELFTAMEEYNARLVTDGQDITDAWDFRQMPSDIDALNHGSSAVGYIEIPEISVSLPLYIGATEENMGNGAVVLAGTSMPVGGDSTNCVIAAHRGWGGSPYFRDIDQLEVGSEILIHNPWEELSYRVTGTEIIHATECGILHIREGKDMVTLFSCYPYMSPGTKYRLVIYCERKRNGGTKEEEFETTHQTGTTVKEIAEKELVEKGIVIEKHFTEEISGKEDLIRVILPTAVILFSFVVILFRLMKKW